MHTIIECGQRQASKQAVVLPRHRNAGLELVLSLYGSAVWDFEGHPVIVPPGHLSFTWPWQWHGAMNDHLATTAIYWLILPVKHTVARNPRALEMAKPFNLMPAENRALFKTLASQTPPVLAVSPLAINLMIAAISELRAHDHKMTLQSRTLIAALLAQLCRKMEASIHAKSSTLQRVEQFLDRLEKECQKPWTLAEMAEACGLGRTHFSAEVRRLKGETPIQHLNRLRVQHAQKLLKQDENKSITDIAFECGFQSSQYFATVFRAFAGQSPSEFALAIPRT